MYAFGHGLSYTIFDYSDLEVSGGETIRASFTITNTGEREGADVPQVYLAEAPEVVRMRLLGFERIELAPGKSREVTLTADPRLLAWFDGAANQWRITDGAHEVALGRSAGDLVLTGSANLTGGFSKSELGHFGASAQWGNGGRTEASSRSRQPERRAAMATFARLDVSQARTTVCIVDERGLVTWRGSCVTSPAAIAQILTAQASLLERVGLESGPLAPWLVHELRALELPVVCLDARHARAALSMQINKSDANDADGLAQIVRTGWYREVEVKSIESHLVRATLGVRKQLVGMRTEMINQIRGLMKIFGLILPKGSGARFEAGVRARIAEKAELGVVVEPLLAAWRALDDQVAALEQQLVRRARRHEVCHRLMTVPGVGPLTALAFVTTVDDPTRFRRSRVSVLTSV